ncbi:unnamed protein product [Wickerhamomyces anomalus]
MSKENPYVPKYIKDAPWYQPKTNPEDYLSHHRTSSTQEPNSEPKIGQGIKDEFIPTEEIDPTSQQRHRIKKKGRCKNCGGDHDKKDCLERPGLINVKQTGKVSKRNEDVDYDGKRDRWYGYDVNDYTKYLKDWKEKEAKKEPEEKREYDTDEEIELKELGLLDDPEFKDAAKQDGEKIIRLREDKAVYLTNVRNENISYDPKSRMIRDDKTGYYNDSNLFVRHLTGEAKEFENSKKFAWDEKKRGIIDDNLVANPTLADRKIEKMSEEEKLKKDKLKKSILDRYGGSLSISNNDEDGEEEEDEEPQAQVDPTKSKYPEDVYHNNHTSVWGSYYSDGKWGYGCCKSLYKNSYCSK